MVTFVLFAALGLAVSYAAPFLAQRLASPTSNAGRTADPPSHSGVGGALLLVFAAIGLSFSLFTLVNYLAPAFSSASLLESLARVGPLLETDDGFRGLLGFVFGIGLSALLRHWRWTRARAEAGAPWWGSPGSVLPAVLLGLFIYAIVAPRGELDMGFIKSARTPLGDLEFNRFESELRLDIVSEPQTFFVLDERGLGLALEMAEAEFRYKKAKGASENEEFKNDVQALRFISLVLEPLTQCIRQIDDFYGDQLLLGNVLSGVGRMMRTSIALSAEKYDEAQATGAPIKDMMTLHLSSLQEGRRLHEAPLGIWLRGGNTVNLCTSPADKIASAESTEYEQSPAIKASAMERTRQSHRSIETGISEGSLEGSLDSIKAVSPPAQDASSRSSDMSLGPGLVALRQFDEMDLRRALASPLTVHAAATFFMWSGNPRAALELISAWRTVTGDKRTHPGLVFLEGFALRWQSVAQPGAAEYLEKWHDALNQAEKKTMNLALDPAKHCRVVSDIENNTIILDQPKNVDAMINAGCGEECRVLAHAFFRHFALRVMNHISFEGSREMLAAGLTDERDTIIPRVEKPVASLRAFLENNGYLADGCGVLIARRRADEISKTVDVTTTTHKIDEALYYDSVGLFDLAVGAQGDEDSLLRAGRNFRAALGHTSELGQQLRRNIEAHREMVVDALDRSR